MDAVELDRVRGITELERIIGRPWIAIDDTVHHPYEGADGFEMVGHFLPAIGVIIRAIGNGDKMKTDLSHQAGKDRIPGNVLFVAGKPCQGNKKYFRSSGPGIILYYAIHKIITGAHLVDMADKRIPWP